MQLSLYLAVEKERVKINAGGFFEVNAGFDQEDNVPWLWGVLGLLFSYVQGVIT